MSSTNQQPTFTLYTGFTTPNQIVWSPFVTKLEFRLRHSHIKYTTETGSRSQSPKGKVPYIIINHGESATRSGDNDDILSDSTHIINRLVREGHLTDLNSTLSSEQKLADLSIRSLLEDKLYFIGMHERWVVNYYAQRDHILSQLSLPVRSIAALLIYRNITATLHGQGIGRYSNDEIDAFRREIWQTIEDQLVEAKRKNGGDASEPFWILGGSHPTEADATLFGFVTSVLVATSNPGSQKLVRGFPTIMDYADRIMRKYFLDYQHWDD